MIEDETDLPKNPTHLKTSYEDALSFIGKCFGKIQIILTICCGFVIMEIISETMMMSIIMPAAQCDLNLTSADKGILSASAILGIMTSSHLFAYLADTRGRRKVLIISLLSSVIVTSITATFVNKFWIFTILRFISGFCISGCSSAGNAYLGEYNVEKHRPTIFAWAAILSAISTIYMFSLGLLILPQTWSFALYTGTLYRPWRLLMLTYKIPGMIALTFLYFLKESPRYYLSKGRDQEALNVLKWVYCVNCGRLPNTFPIKELESEFDENHQKRMMGVTGASAFFKEIWNQTAPLFNPPFVLNILICCLSQFSILGISNGLAIWYPEVINKLSDSNSTGKLCEILDNYYTPEAIIETQSQECNDTINSEVFYQRLRLEGYSVILLITVAFVIKYGRNYVFAFCFIMSGICGLIMLNLTNTTIISALLGFHIILPGLLIPVVVAVIVDVIPTHLRAMSICIVFVVGGFGAIVASNIVGMILQEHCRLTFSLFAITALCTAALTYFLPKKQLQYFQIP